MTLIYKDFTDNNNKHKVNTFLSPELAIFLRFADDLIKLSFFIPTVLA